MTKLNYDRKPVATQTQYEPIKLTYAEKRNVWADHFEKLRAEKLAAASASKKKSNRRKKNKSNSRTLIMGNTVILSVPFVEKDEAKRLGARWDATNRTWYAINDKRISRFARWLPKPKTPPDHGRPLTDDETKPGSIHQTHVIIDGQRMRIY